MSPDRAFVSRPVRRRGEPVMVLAMLLVGWIGVRALLWEGLPLLPIPAEMTARREVAEPAEGPARLAPTLARLHSTHRPAPPAMALPAPPLLLQPALQPPQLALAGPEPALAPLPPRPLRAQIASAHALLWMAAVSQMPLLEGTPVPAGLQPAAMPPPAKARMRRWSGDGWLLARGGGQGFGPAGSLPTYGASQLGAVLRYRLDSGASPYRPALYARVSGALSGPAGALGEREAAMGLSARPVPGVPLRVMVEARVSRFAGGATRLRPAASLVSEVAPITLPLATRAEFYAQAGYVGGVAATAFVDGQIRLDRHIAQVGPAELRGGAGAWGGAQTGGGRLDVGPGLTLRAAAGPTAARLAMDWRFRVAGTAAPASGPALTLSAGF